MKNQRCKRDIDAEVDVAALSLPEFLAALREGTGEYWHFDHVMLRAANEIERLRRALEIIAAQTSGIPASVKLSDCMAATASAALRHTVEPSDGRCNHNLDSPTKTLKAVMGEPYVGFDCTVCHQRWGFSEPTPVRQPHEWEGPDRLGFYKCKNCLGIAHRKLSGECSILRTT